MGQGLRHWTIWYIFIPYSKDHESQEPGKFLNSVLSYPDIKTYSYNPK